MNKYLIYALINAICSVFFVWFNPVYLLPVIAISMFTTDVFLLLERIIDNGKNKKYLLSFCCFIGCSCSILIAGGLCAMIYEPVYTKWYYALIQALCCINVAYNINKYLNLRKVV